MMITDSQKKGLVDAFNAYLDSTELKRKAVDGLGGIKNFSYEDIMNLKENSPQFRPQENTFLYQDGREVGQYSQTQNTTFPIHMKVIYTQ